MIRRSARCSAWVLVPLLTTIFLAAPAMAADRILVFAAASLKNALDDADAAYKAKTGVEVAASYAASGPLAKQIENGAPADLFISADLKWMDELAAKKLIKADTRKDLLGNSLVLVAPADKTVTVKLAPGLHLKPLIGDGKLSIGDPKSVPAGEYAEQALKKLGSWDEVAAQLASAENVRAALALVSRGEAPLGIVYATDAMSDKGVHVVGTFPEDSHQPIVYPVALVAAGTNPATPAFLAWLESAEAAPFFTKQGFVRLK